MFGNIVYYDKKKIDEYWILGGYHDTCFFNTEEFRPHNGRLFPTGDLLRPL